jgi:hypothetical protein
MRKLIKIAPLFLGMLLLSMTLSAQQITFQLQGSEEIILTNETGSLNFNELSPGEPYFMAGGEGATVDLTQNQDKIIVIRVQAPAHLDVSVDVSSSPMSLVCTANCPSPLPELEFQLGWAFWNRSVSNDLVSVPSMEQLVSGAIEVLSADGLPLNYTSAVFPMRRRSYASAAPAPPPIPDHDGYVDVPSTSAFILIYGRLGTISSSVQSGSYSASIIVEATTPNYP